MDFRTAPTLSTPHIDKGTEKHSEGAMRMTMRRRKKCGTNFPEHFSGRHEQKLDTSWVTRSPVLAGELASSSMETSETADEDNKT